MTKEQLITYLTKTKTRKLLEASVWSDLTTALGGLTTEEKDDIAVRIATGAGQAVINKIQSEMETNAEALATTEVTAALADDTLSLAELDSLL